MKPMVELKPCPFCGCKAQCSGFARDYPIENLQIYVACNTCGAEINVTGNTSTVEKLKRKVITAWNRRSALENNPLTLDQLRQMEGEAVWCVDSERNVFCMLVDSENNLCVDVECNYWEFSSYAVTDDSNKLRQGSWLAYARKPEV